jgi:LysM repeat protein
LESASSEYTVVKGDTLASIANNNKVTLKALQAANPKVDSRRLRIGQKLHIPAAAVSSEASGATVAAASSGVSAEGAEKVYTVKAGDNLARIAKNHHTTVKAITALNGLKSANTLKVGQKLKMPTAKAAAPAVPVAPPSEATTPSVEPAVPAPVFSSPSASTAAHSPTVARHTAAR